MLQPLLEISAVFSYLTIVIIPPCTKASMGMYKQTSVRGRTQAHTIGNQWPKGQRTHMRTCRTRTVAAIGDTTSIIEVNISASLHVFAHSQLNLWISRLSHAVIKMLASRHSHTSTSKSAKQMKRESDNAATSLLGSTAASGEIFSWVQQQKQHQQQ